MLLQILCYINSFVSVIISGEIDVSQNHFERALHSNQQGFVESFYDFEHVIYALVFDCLVNSLLEFLHKYLVELRDRFGIYGKSLNECFQQHVDLILIILIESY